MTPNHSEVVIQTQALTKQYKTVTALANLDLTVHKNSIFGFLGPNGAGKTTAIKSLLGLIRPTSGSGTIFGHDIRTESLKIRSRVGYLPQEPRFYDYMTARETLDFTARFFFKGPEPAIRQRVDETLELVGLAGKADRPIKSFSGGERQRLGIGQAQVNYPDLLILDEPAASLDPLGRRDVLAVMERLRKYATVFYSTHILDDVQRVSDTIAILNNGQLVAQGAVETLLAGSGGTSYTVKLQGALEAARRRLDARDWVLATQLQENREDATLVVSVSDNGAAEMHLLRILLEDPDIVVKDYRRRTYELEDIFMEIIEGGKDVGK